MQPIKPETVDRILRERQDVTRDDIQEYHRLQGERFSVDPYRPKTADEEKAHADREQRLKQLEQKIYGAR